MNLRRRACIVGAVLAAAGGGASPAGAHAILVSSEPADLSSVPTTSRELRLVFSEPVRREFARLAVRRLDGLSVSARPVVRGQEVRASLPVLRRGTYVVDWTVMAVGDSHVSTGIVVFGAGVRAAAVPRPDQAGPRLVEVALRWLDLSLLALLVGALVAATFVLRAANARTARRRSLVTAAAAGGMALATGAGLLAWQAWRLADGSLVDAADIGVKLLGSGWGAEWALRQCLVAALAAIALLGLRGARPLVLTALVVPGTVGLALAHALSSHADALSSSRALAVALDAAHVLAAAVWVGGLAALAFALRGAPPAVARVAWRRFGVVAGAGVATLVATGLYLAGRQVASLDALVTTVYGQTLLVKVGLVALAGAIGLANLQALRRGRALRLVSLEAVVGIAVVLGAAVLTAAVPAQGPQFAPAADSPASTLAASHDDLLVTLTVTPNRPGPNVYDARIVSSRRPAPAPIESVRLRFGTVVTGPLQRIAPGRYRAGGGELRRAGRVSVEADVARRGLPRTRVAFSWTVGPAGTTHRAVLSDRPLGPFLVGAAAAFTGVVLFVTVLMAWRRRLERLDVGAVRSWRSTS